MDIEAAAKALFEAEPHAHPQGHIPEWGIQPESIKNAFRRRARALAMANEQPTQAPPMVGPNAPIGAPPTMNVGQIQIAAGPAEFGILLGQTRMLPQPVEGGVNIVQLIEWFAALTMSPVVAQQLCEGLTLALKEYKDKIGPIPKGAEPKLSGSPKR